MTSSVVALSEAFEAVNLAPETKWTPAAPGSASEAAPASASEAAPGSAAAAATGTAALEVTTQPARQVRFALSWPFELDVVKPRPQSRRKKQHAKHGSDAKSLTLRHAAGPLNYGIIILRRRPCNTRPNDSKSDDKACVMDANGLLMEAGIECVLVETHNGNLDFIKGLAKPGERPLQTAERKMVEESGITPDMLQYVPGVLIHEVDGHERNVVAYFVAQMTKTQQQQQQQQQQKTLKVNQKELRQTSWFCVKDALDSPALRTRRKQVLHQAIHELLKRL
jgi:8-oxo-dGTP pyrophosphatase MutT (NUDIX family)